MSGQTKSKQNGNIILFSSSFNREVKNYKLAKQSVKELNDVTLVELKGYSRQEVCTLINASDAILVTSLYETGPLIVKEALACNTPVISTDVGDVKELIKGLNNCYIVGYNRNEIIERINSILSNTINLNSYKNIKKYSLNNVSIKIKNIYLEILR